MRMITTTPFGRCGAVGAKLQRYFFARITKNGWVESNEKEFRAKILIKSEWVKTNVTKFVDKYGTTSKLNSPIRDVKPPLREAPPVLELEEHEKFCDDEGNVYEVEVRGVREEDKIYFKGSDVQKVFEMENLVKNIKRDHTNLEDYEQFSLLSQNPLAEDSGTTVKIVKRTFFTYNGLLKVIFNSRCGVGKKFRKWATKIIYTAHLGTDEQRYEQALDIAGVNATLVKQVFDTCVTKVPCVYLFYVGRVSKMLKYYPELKKYRSGMLFKFGMTISLHRRLIEHIKDYGSLRESSLKLSQWSPINEKCISKAETVLSRYFNDKKVPFQGHDEIVILSRTDMVEVKAKYMEIYNTFGIVTEMVKILAKNDKLVENYKYQKLMLQEKDARTIRPKVGCCQSPFGRLDINELNHQIELCQERELEWNNEKKEWNNREQEWNNEKRELMNQNTMLLKQLARK